MTFLDMLLLHTQTPVSCKYVHWETRKFVSLALFQYPLSCSRLKPNPHTSAVCPSSVYLHNWSHSILIQWPWQVAVPTSQIPYGETDSQRGWVPAQSHTASKQCWFSNIFIFCKNPSCAPRCVSFACLWSFSSLCYGSPVSSPVTSAAYICQANLVIWVAVICNQKEAQRKIGRCKESRGHWVFFLSFFPQHIQKGDVLVSMVLFSMCGGLWQLEVQQGQQHRPWSSTDPGTAQTLEPVRSEVLSPIGNTSFLKWDQLPETSGLRLPHLLLLLCWLF